MVTVLIQYCTSTTLPPIVITITIVIHSDGDTIILFRRFGISLKKYPIIIILA